MRKRSMFVLLSMLSLCLTIKPLAVNASQNSSILVTGNLDKVEQTTSEIPKEKEKLKEKQTIIKESNLPKTGEMIDEKIIILGCLIIGITIIVFVYKRKKTT
ncbi:LPXTG cell wall anchor domain-containing protein [Listeria monocytogenes]|uniref:LPXTG cell wall anchor domain-containing protein n=1 Tax=Listeria monocytogenes TaxID=1639 RepID=UPI001F10605E|nr:LPXTG cell wall anchor domain-containing protein [Listeria monocytogenes]MCH5002094.1 LPXTG cell wall anchor domain-containing protein [Listeria monocytogenes]MCH5012150.1 LPXTG cell wall anchor domain-containing protein [Listeria monocytogenes]MCH5025541.1 LPXTG cell wall anchor domain-containing protein [Listeria monocytogenes]MCH5056821.1 LPXTG cell wall anchor domain-containing protein [Listeria monocytogenes]MCH5060233.1 LPXTG cell wall anchor domain-containing protein [Listeria monocy